jgi:hypothetical protein
MDEPLTISQTIDRWMTGRRAGGTYKISASPESVPDAKSVGIGRMALLAERCQKIGI